MGLKPRGAMMARLPKAIFWGLLSSNLVRQVSSLGRPKRQGGRLQQDRCPAAEGALVS